ncbi:MAG: hypothetical protein HC851_10525 [Acaryochloris sp. RU_4_1]|nr:hypothetical protein [Acaryochloris sp. RU_4_1]NJR53756.1 hypothetical protein [Acaryochloris sp. CRU_2_0]
MVIQHPVDVEMSESSLFFRIDWDGLTQNKVILLLKCLVYLQSLSALSEAALEEAADELEGIANFHSDRLPTNNLPSIPVATIKGKLRSTQVRPPIVLES